MAQMSPFQLFGLKPAFTIDLERLEAAYQAGMMKVHPDRFAGRPAAERRGLISLSLLIRSTTMIKYGKASA